MAANEASKKDEGGNSKSIGTGPATKNKHAVNSGASNTIDASESRRSGTKETANRKQQHHQNNNQVSTKLRINNNGNSRSSLARDIIMAFIPMFVLFKISTHPYVAEIGNRDANTPTTQSQLESLKQLMFKLSLKQQREKLQREHRFLGAMNEQTCYDSCYDDPNPTIKIIQPANNKNQQKGARPKQQQQFNGNKKKSFKNQRRKHSTISGGGNKIKPGKMNRPMARRPSAPPTGTPFGTLIGRAFWGDPSYIVNKGSESSSASNDGSVGELQDAKKGGGRKIIKAKKKRKFGSRR